MPNRRALALGLSFGLLVVAHGAAADLKVGTAVEDITPPVGMRIAGGYTSPISTGVHDPLRVRAIVLEQGGERVAIAVCDLTGVFRAVTDRARAEAGRATGIPVDHIVISATHTHGAPQYAGPIRDLEHEAAVAATGKDGREPIDYPALVADRCARAIARANEGLKPARLDVGVARQGGLAFNRRFHMKDGRVQFNPGKKNPNVVRPAGPVDEDLPILLVRDVDGRPRASLVTFAMHVASYGGLQFGADFPAGLEMGLRKPFGPDFVSVFAEGTAGDINHIDVTTDRPQPTTTEPGRIASALSTTILAAIPGLRPVTAPALAARSVTLRLPLQEVTDEQVTRAVAVFRRDVTPTPAFDLLVASDRTLDIRDRRRWYGDAHPAEIQAIRVGADTAIVALPFEVFVELGMAIKKGSPFANTLVISLSEDAGFYIPTRKAFAEGSYEVDTCGLKPGCGEAMVEAAVGLLRGLAP